MNGPYGPRNGDAAESVGMHTTAFGTAVNGGRVVADTGHDQDVCVETDWALGWTTNATTLLRQPMIDDDLSVLMAWFVAHKPHGFNPQGGFGDIMSLTDYPVFCHDQQF